MNMFPFYIKLCSLAIFSSPSLHLSFGNASYLTPGPLMLTIDAIHTDG